MHNRKNLTTFMWYQSRCYELVKYLDYMSFKALTYEFTLLLVGGEDIFLNEKKMAHVEC